jgi:hypothetical protein
MPKNIDPDLYDLADFRNDQIRGKSARSHGQALNDNPNSFGKAPGNASWHAWREGWFMEYGKAQYRIRDWRPGGEI